MQVGLRNGLPIMAPVDNAGVFTEEAGPFQGALLLSYLCKPFEQAYSCTAATLHPVRVTNGSWCMQVLLYWMRGQPPS